MTKPYLSPAKFRIFAHRGSTEGGALENTIEAFVFAQKAGIQYLETDVQATRDGVPVIFHDHDLWRVFSDRRKISQITFQELQELAGKIGARISTLFELLTALPHCKFNIDFKSKAAIPAGTSTIVAVGAQERVLISSFSRKRRHDAISRVPGVATSADAPTLLWIWILFKLGLVKAVSKACRDLDALQIPIKFGPIRFDNREFLRVLSQYNVEVHFWTINDFHEAKRLMGLGAKGIVTDQSKMMVERFRNEGIEII